MRAATPREIPIGRVAHQILQVFFASLFCWGETEYIHVFPEKDNRKLERKQRKAMTPPPPIEPTDHWHFSHY